MTHRRKKVSPDQGRLIFPPRPCSHPCLSSILRLVDGPDPWAAFWGLMRAAGRPDRPQSRTAHAGSAGRHLVRAYGVEGRGATAQEAAAMWVEGARAVVGCSQ